MFGCVCLEARLNKAVWFAGTPCVHHVYLHTLHTCSHRAYFAATVFYHTPNRSRRQETQQERVYMLHTYARNVFANAVALHSYGQTHTHAHVLLRCPPNCYTSLTNVMLIIIKKKAACALLWRIPYPIYKSLVSSEL